jgi:thiamine biosynthesis lipoprotein
MLMASGGVMTSATVNPSLEQRSATLVNHVFSAMNTVVRLVAFSADAGAAFEDAERYFASFEARFSRFLADSELSQLNRAGGRAFAASADMIELLTLAMAMRERTGGIFDPFVLPALEHAGYDRSFELIAEDATNGVAPTAAPSARVEMDTGGTVRLAAGVRIDLGGIGKGYCVDRVAEKLAGVRDFVVDAGGDIAARGRGPDGDGWVIAVADPFDDVRDIGSVRLHDEAIATSTTMRRRWRCGGEIRHHIMDPRTGRSAVSDLVQVSVIARSAAEADVYAKAALILGSIEGATLLRDAGLAALLVDGRSRCSTIGNWPGVA